MFKTALHLSVVGEGQEWLLLQKYTSDDGKERKGQFVCQCIILKGWGKMVTYFHMSSFKFSLYHFNIMSKSETRLKADYTISMAALHNN